MTATLAHNTVRILALAMVVSGIASPGFAEPPTKAKGNGGYLSAYGYDTSGCVWSSVYVTRGGTTAAPQTWLSYDVYNGCTGQWIAAGWGLIANSAFKTGNKTASLVVTPTANANFCVQGEAGSIEIRVRADGVYSYSYSGHTRSEYAGHVYQSHGFWTERSASGTATVLGFDQREDARFVFGEGRDKYMEIDRGSK